MYSSIDIKKIEMLRNSVFRSLKRQIHVVSVQNVKPVSQTHSSLKCYNFSPVDQFSPKNYIPIVFYYPSCLTFSSIKQQEDDNIAKRLKRSLSETLVQYYRFSGRLNSSTSHLDCNNEGVEFQEVDIKCQMDQVLDQESLSLVFPDGGIWGNVNENSPLLSVRLANYICGGVSVAVSMSHKIADAKTFQTFMTSWATKTRLLNYSSNSNEDVPAPHFVSHPPPNTDVPELDFFKKDFVARTFMFPKSKLTKLKEIVSHKTGLERISGFELVTALLSKCASTANSASSGFFTPFNLLYSINMRDKVLPPLPETSIGNFYWVVNNEIKNETENNLNTLLEKIREGKKRMEGVKTLDAKLILSTLHVSYNGNDIHFCSTLCKMQFYKVDFGWGNPSRVVIAASTMNNSFFLMDTPNGDGIEAVVTLSEKSMTAFQQENDIIEFTSSQTY